jgi:predicted ferric reductase
MNPWVWWLDRAAGLVLLVLLTSAVVTGLWSTASPPRGVPRFATLAMHRNLALLALGLLAVHVGSSVVDTFVGIRWSQIVVPATSGFRPLWVGLGTVAVDLMLAVIATSLVRHRLGLRAWRAVHLAVWPAWALGIGHALALGTDLREGRSWALLPAIACLLAVAVAGTARLMALGLAPGARR